MSTPLPEIDPEAVAAFWQRAIDAGAVPAGTPIPSYAGPFGDSVELADELIALVVDGPKRATAGAMAEYLHHGWELPVVGTRWIATDGAGVPRVVLRTTDVRVGPLSSVDDAFAWDEGEGDRTRPDWLEGHTGYFSRSLPAIGVGFHPEIEVVFERFAVDHRE